MNALLGIVRDWIETREAVSSRWRMQNTGFVTGKYSQSGINEFAAAMDYRTKQLMQLVEKEATLSPQAFFAIVQAGDLFAGQWQGFIAVQRSVSPEWNEKDSESVYELVMNFGKFL